MQTATDQQRFCGRKFTAEEVSLIQEVVKTCAGISRLELAPHRMRTVGVETPRRRTQGSGVKGSSGAIGEPGGFDTSGQKVVWIEQTQEAHCAR